MRFRHRTSTNVDPDMTPMIDVTFQLIAFFMFTINFSDAEQHRRVDLPASTAAKPPEVAYDHSLMIQLTGSGEYLVEGKMLPDVAALRAALIRERQRTELSAAAKLDDVIVVIRADRDAPAGRVQEIIQLSQEVGFQRLVLRSQQAAAP